MFLLTDNVAEGRRAVHHMRSCLAPVAPGPVIEIGIGGATLLWFAVAVDDELHRYGNGIILGSPSISRWQKGRVVDHQADVLGRIHPLCSCVVIEIEPGGARVAATGVAGVYVCGPTVADSQLILADALRLVPSPRWVAVLAAVGYLPGTATLFEGVRRLDYRASYSVGSQHEWRPAELLERRPPDDRAMIGRMASLVPQDAKLVATATAGSDTRFLLGVLCRAGTRPRLVHIDGEERQQVEVIARELDLPLQVAERVTELPPRLYTLLTDAQVYFRGGSLGRMRAVVDGRTELLFASVSYEAILRNFFCSAWKLPGMRRSMLRRLVRWGLLNATPARIEGLAACSTRKELARLIHEDVVRLKPLTDNWARKPAASLFYFYNRALRWSTAMVADLRPFCRVATFLADRETVELGITSTAWSNFRRDRVRLLNQRLLPQLTVPYANGLPVVPNRGLAGSWGRVWFEYGTRLGFRLTAARRIAGQAPSLEPASCELGDADPVGSYFTRPIDEIITDRRVPFGVRRAAVTMSHILDFLADSQPAPPTSDASRASCDP